MLVFCVVCEGSGQKGCGGFMFIEVWQVIVGLGDVYLGVVVEFVVCEVYLQMIYSMEVEECGVDLCVIVDVVLVVEFSFDFVLCGLIFVYVQVVQDFVGDLLGVEVGVMYCCYLLVVCLQVVQ